MRWTRWPRSTLKQALTVASRFTFVFTKTEQDYMPVSSGLRGQALAQRDGCRMSGTQQ